MQVGAGRGCRQGAGGCSSELGSHRGLGRGPAGGPAEMQAGGGQGSRRGLGRGPAGGPSAMQAGVQAGGGQGSHRGLGRGPTGGAGRGAGRGSSRGAGRVRAGHRQGAGAPRPDLGSHRGTGRVRAGCGQGAGSPAALIWGPTEDAGRVRAGDAGRGPAGVQAGRRQGAWCCAAAPCQPQHALQWGPS